LSIGKGNTFLIKNYELRIKNFQFRGAFVVFKTIIVITRALFQKKKMLRRGSSHVRIRRLARMCHEWQNGETGSSAKNGYLSITGLTSQ
ncbi:MAG: hypothetical protein IKS64_01180, partial [Muribaculaceae bacterium]|nr:hypothetical protein [Muribaculaceae bacterium]